MAFRIFLHTFRMIFGNLGQALKVSVGPYLLLIGGVMLLGLLAGSFATAGASSRNYQLIGLLPLLFMPVVFFVTSWVAVSWHRFILLEEYTAILPAVGDRPIWSYAGKGILLGLLVGLIAVPLMLILAALSLGPMVPFGSGGVSNSIILSLLSMVAVFIALSVFGMRFGISLVGVALGKPMTFGDAFRATKPMNNSIVVLSILMALTNLVPNYLLGSIMLSAPNLVMVLNLALAWLSMMLGISILTTLYGHVIEGRNV